MKLCPPTSPTPVTCTTISRPHRTAEYFCFPPYPCFPFNAATKVLHLWKTSICPIKTLKPRVRASIGGRKEFSAFLTARKKPQAPCPAMLLRQYDAQDVRWHNNFTALCHLCWVAGFTNLYLHYYKDILIHHNIKNYLPNIVWVPMLPAKQLWPVKVGAPWIGLLFPVHHTYMQFSESWGQHLETCHALKPILNNFVLCVAGRIILLKESTSNKECQEKVYTV